MGTTKRKAAPTPIESMTAGEFAAAVGAVGDIATVADRARSTIVAGVARLETLLQEERAAHEETRESWREKFDSLQRASDNAIRESAHELEVVRRLAGEHEAKALGALRDDLTSKHAAALDKVTRELTDEKAAHVADVKRLERDATEARTKADAEIKRLAAALADAEAKLRKAAVLLA